MVRLRRLRLLRRRDRPRLLSRAGQGRPGAGRLRRVRRRLHDAADRRCDLRPCRRPHRPLGGAHPLGGGDGGADLPDRRPAGLRRARAWPRRCCSPCCAWCRACRSAASTRPPSSSWSSSARPGAPRRGRRRRRPRRGVGHPAGLGDRRHSRMADAGGSGGRLGLAHSLLDRPFRRRRRPGAAPRLRRGRDSAPRQRAPSARRCSRPSPIIGACWSTSPAYRCSGRSAST